MRITGGRFRSRRLVAPRGSATRPTSDRVREALFSLLSARISWDGARILDIYAGSGSLSFEALSRGAASAVLIDLAREAKASIDENARTLAVVPCVRVLTCGVEKGLVNALTHGPYDVIFADPPYADVADGQVVKAFGAVSWARLLAADGIFVLEHASRNEAPALAELAQIETRRYGDTALTLFCHPAGTPADEPPRETSGDAARSTDDLLERDAHRSSTFRRVMSGHAPASPDTIAIQSSLTITERRFRRHHRAASPVVVMRAHMRSCARPRSFSSSLASLGRGECGAGASRFGRARCRSLRNEAPRNCDARCLESVYSPGFKERGAAEGSSNPSRVRFVGG